MVESLAFLNHFETLDHRMTDPEAYGMFPFDLKTCCGDDVIVADNEK